MKEKPEKQGIRGIVIALCRDFPRREEALLGQSLGLRCAMEYRYLNAVILEAVREAVGDRLARDFIREIGEETGYAKSRLDCLAEGTYKSYKSMAVHNIARRLHLEEEGWG